MGEDLSRKGRDYTDSDVAFIAFGNERKWPVGVLATLNESRAAEESFAGRRPLARDLSSRADHSDDGQIFMSSSDVPDSSRLMSQPGFRPRPVHVSSGLSGLRYIGTPVALRRPPYPRCTKHFVARDIEFLGSFDDLCKEVPLFFRLAALQLFRQTSNLGSYLGR